MNKDKLKFYKDIHWIRSCKVCGVEYRPRRFSTAEKSRLCYVCRNKKFTELMRKWRAGLSPERKKYYSKMNRPRWQKWYSLHKKAFNERMSKYYYKNLKVNRKKALERYYKNLEVNRRKRRERYHKNKKKPEA